MGFKEFILWSIPIILGIGFPSLISHWRKKRDISLYFQPLACYKLFRKDIKKLNIDIRYQGVVIENNLILFKGSLTNNGHKDIAKEHIHKKLEITAASAYIWREFHITKSPKGVTINIKNENNRIEFDWDLLQRGERFEFETLIEVNDPDPKSRDFLDSIQFNYRITDLHAIDKEEVNETDPRSFLLLWLIVIIMAMAYSIVPYFKKEYNIQYTVLNHQQDTITIKVETINKTQQLKLNNGTIEKQISTADFEKEYKILEIKTTPVAYIYTNAFQNARNFFIFSFIPFFLYFFLKARNVKRIKNTIN